MTRAQREARGLTGPRTLGLSLARAATLAKCDGPGQGHMPSEYRAARRGDWTDAANYADATIAHYLDE